jgi:hypothetical protein
MSSIRHPAVTCLFLALVTTMPASASIRGASFGVSVRVVARTWLEPVDEPAFIVLTNADLEQGYKELDVHYRVHTAGTSRYLLNIAPRTGLTDRIHIDGLGAAVELGEADVTVLQQASANVDELRLRLRLTLSSGLAAGHYPMPVRLSVSAS